MNTSIDILRGRAAAMRPVVPDDYPALYGLATTGRSSIGWRLHGRSMNPDAFAALLWEGTALQFVVTPVGMPTQVLGNVALFNHDPANGTAYLSVLLRDDVAGSSTMFAEVVVAFSRYAFSVLGLRKVYAETTEFSVPGLDEIAARCDCVREEGRLAGHLRINGALWDVVVLAIYADGFDADMAHIIRFLGAQSNGTLPPGRVEFREMCALLAEQLDIPALADAEGGTSLREELGLDSLHVVEAIVAIEDAYGVCLEPGDLVNLRTVQDMHAVIERSLRQVA